MDDLYQTVKRRLGVIEAEQKGTTVQLKNLNEGQNSMIQSIGGIVSAVTNLGTQVDQKIEAHEKRYHSRPLLSSIPPKAWAAIPGPRWLKIAIPVAGGVVAVLSGVEPSAIAKVFTALGFGIAP